MANSVQTIVHDAKIKITIFSRMPGDKIDYQPSRDESQKSIA